MRPIHLITTRIEWIRTSRLSINKYLSCREATSERATIPTTTGPAGEAISATYALCPIPYTLCPVPYALYPTPYALHYTPYTLHPMPYTLCPTPYTLHLTPYALYPTPYALHPMPYTLHPMPCTQSYALYPTPHTGKRLRRGRPSRRRLGQQGRPFPPPRSAACQWSHTERAFV